MSDLTYLAPPLIGALIGYLSNFLTLKMLFRPLQPRHFLGLRVPLTPGVIPANRHRLARNIGEMVGRQLLTPEDIRRALSRADFQRDLRRLLSDQVNTIFAAEQGPVDSLVPERFRSYFRVGIKIVRWRFLKHLHNHLDGEAFAEALREAVAQGDSQGQSWSNEELLALFRARRVKRMLDRLLIDLIETRLLAQPLGRLGDLLPKEVQAGMDEYLRQQINHLLERKVPPLVDALNVREIVIRKIDELEPLRLEGLLLAGIEERFKYLNLGGACLGFCLGLLHLFLLAGI